MHESIVFCSTCTMSSYRTFMFAISSPGEFLVGGVCPELINYAHKYWQFEYTKPIRIQSHRS